MTKIRGLALGLLMLTSCAATGARERVEESTSPESLVSEGQKSDKSQRVPPEDKKPAWPEADEIFARALQSVGGAEQLQAIQGYWAQGSIEVDPGTLGKMTLWVRAPNLTRTRVEIGSWVIEEGYDGISAWSMDPLMGPRLKSEREAQDAIRRADLYAPIHYAQHFPQRKTVGPTTFADTPAWQIRVKTRAGLVEQHYFDQKSGRPLGFQAQVLSGVGAVKVTSSYEQWRAFGAFWMPLLIRQRVGDQQQVIRLDRVKFKAPKRVVFRPPGQVKPIHLP